MKVVTLQGTYDIDLSAMKVTRSIQGSCRSITEPLQEVPSPVVGQRMMINGESTAPVTEVTR